MAPRSLRQFMLLSSRTIYSTFSEIWSNRPLQNVRLGRPPSRKKLSRSDRVSKQALLEDFLPPIRKMSKTFPSSMLRQIFVPSTISISVCTSSVSFLSATGVVMIAFHMDTATKVGVFAIFLENEEVMLINLLGLTLTLTLYWTEGM
mmetsp:Transcript_9327/g.10064  ORF Transcript_9327/g.10064 Transcript_9327/m.10064 type:complete len:147 (-) Transcript_9327:137-577(-)